MFFELNGQPRTVFVADRELAATRPARRQAKDGEAGHVGAPMPGMVVAIQVDPGARVARGDPLIAIEAMKMETTVFAESDGIVEEILVQPGERIHVRDLLLVLAPAADAN